MKVIKQGLGIRIVERFLLFPTYAQYEARWFGRERIVQEVTEMDALGFRHSSPDWRDVRWALPGEEVLIKEQI